MAGPLPEGLMPSADGRLPEGIVPNVQTPFSAYVHVPYCRVRCGYCDFNTYTSDELRGSRREAYAETVGREISLARKSLTRLGDTRVISTVFFGGGTPTLLPAETLVAMLDDLRATFDFRENAEVTTEANPDTVDSAYFDALVAGGFTRVSLGVQSVVPHVLATLDRTHDPERISGVVAAAKASGLAVSADVIFGTPGETLDDWRRTLDAVVGFELDHVSAYALIVEAGTALERRIRRGDVAPVDDDLHADMYELAEGVLGGAGLAWYEISNWARTPETRSMHNLAYWRNHDWWGFGPGAHSHIAGARWWNVKHPAEYQRRLEAEKTPAVGYEIPDAPARELERLMLGLRLSEGLEGAGVNQHEVRSLVAAGLLNDEAAQAGQLVLTLAGRLRADEVVRRLVETDD